MEDNPSELQQFRKNIEDLTDIELVQVTNSDEACRILEDKIEVFSAAILDVESYIQSDVKHETSSSFGKVVACIRRCEGRNPIKFFAFTGKGQYLKDKNFENTHQCRVFDKNCDSVAALEYLEKIVSDHPRSVVRQKYKKAFLPFKSEYNELPLLDSVYEESLINLVLAWDNHALRNSNLYNGLIRPLTEKILSNLTTMGVLPVRENWNGRSIAFSNASEAAPEEIPCYVARAVHTIFDVCPEGVHDCALFDKMNRGETPFLLQSITLELFNILAWYKPFCDKFGSDYHETKKFFKQRADILKAQREERKQK